MLSSRIYEMNQSERGSPAIMADNGAGVFLSQHPIRLLAVAGIAAKSHWSSEIARGKTDIKQQTIFRTILISRPFTCRGSLSALIMKNGETGANKIEPTTARINPWLETPAFPEKHLHIMFFENLNLYFAYERTLGINLNFWYIGSPIKCSKVHIIHDT